MARNLDVPIYEDVKTWGTENVSDWLHQIGFYEFVDGFQNKSIDGKRMLTLSADELRRCYPNMRSSGRRADPSEELMKRINQVKTNKKKGFLSSMTSNFNKRNQPRDQTPVPRTPDYPSKTNGHSQYHDNEEAWPDDEFEDEYDDPTPEPHHTHPRSSSYHGSTGTTASSTTTGDDQFYQEPGADDDFGGTYEVPGQNQGMGHEEEDFDQTYDVVPQEDVHTSHGSGHRPQINIPPPQMHTRSPSPISGHGNLPPRPMKTQNLQSRGPAQRDLPTVPSPHRRPQPTPNPGHARVPPTWSQRPGENHSESDEDAEDYLLPNNGELYEVADMNDQPTGFLAPPHEGKRFSQQSLPPPPDEDALYLEAEQNLVEDDLYVDPNDDTSENQEPEQTFVEDDLYVDPNDPNDVSNEPDPSLEQDELYLDPNEPDEPSSRQIQSRELPRPPPVRPPMPTPHDTPPMPERPPKPKPTELKHVNGNNLPPPVIPTRPPAKSPIQRIPMPKVLPNPVIPLQRKMSPVEVAKPPVIQSQEDNDLGDRKPSGGSSLVSDLKNKFNNNSSSDNNHLSTKPRMGPKPFSSQHHNVERKMPDLPTKPRQKSTSNFDTPPGPPASKLPSSRKRIQEAVKPPPIPTPTKPKEVFRPPKTKVEPVAAPSPGPPRPKPRQPPPPRVVTPPEPVKQPSPQPSPPTTPKPPPSPTPTPRHTPKHTPKHDELDGYPWYHKDIKRDKAFKAVKECSQDGAFLVRPSEKGGEDTPYSLTLWYNCKVRNLKIRKRKEDNKFALGNYKDNEVTHDNAATMIQYYQQEPVILARDEGKVVLRIAVPVYN